ncbi:hypothetical protein LTR54_011729 [Friedmanniomyces endolithicus]|nr:hypothetical protein LTS00_009395 [Friedmanniomyces endolithicus]KAK0991808.1 hypothetical protein LTR54_011729 [Friedmanniomyces endolithicus]KAK1048859.1 hypothetical protein LTR74_017436 [Friedmanniomyces endolithicus]
MSVPNSAMRPDEVVAGPSGSVSDLSSRSPARVRRSMAREPSPRAPERPTLHPLTALLRAPSLSRSPSQESLVRPYSWKLDKVKQPDTKSLEEATALANLQANPSPYFRIPKRKFEADTKATAVRFLLPGLPEPPTSSIPVIFLSTPSGHEERPRRQPLFHDFFRERQYRCMVRLKRQRLEKRLDQGSGTEATRLARGAAADSVQPYGQAGAAKECVELGWEVEGVEKSLMGRLPVGRPARWLCECLEVASIGSTTWEALCPQRWHLELIMPARGTV